MVEPNIIKTKYYTLVSADTGHGKTLWCKKKVARLLRTTQDRIIVIDVTGEYADFVLDHDRIVPGRIPMVMHQYKLSGGWPIDTHIIEVDMPMNRQPQLIVYDVSRTMGTWHRGVLAISDTLLGYMTGRENTTTWLFLNLDPYFYEKQDDETSWKILEHFVKQQGQTVKPVFTSQKFSADTINQRLHIEEAVSQGATIKSESKADTSADYVVDDRGVGLSGLDKDWQRTETVHKAIEQIILDADVEVFLSYDMIHYFSNKNFYGSAFWTDMLQEFGCEAVRYHGLEYYDVESNVVMLYFDGKQLCDNPDYVPEEEVKDIDAWFCYTFDMELDAGDTFTVKQVDKMQETIASVRSVFGREEGDEVADVDEDCITICTGVTLKPEQIPEFVKLLQTMNDIAEESGGTLEYTAEFTPAKMDTFAAMIMDKQGDKIIPRFYRY